MRKEGREVGGRVEENVVAVLHLHKAVTTFSINLRSVWGGGRESWER